MDNKSALEKKYQKILEKLGEQITFYTDDIQEVFPGMKKSSLYWNMSKLVEKGYLKRVRNGVYAFNEWYGTSLQELVRIYENVVRLGILDKKKWFLLQLKEICNMI
ncbi:MAG: hypothetical protein PHY47_18240 [Lachnospiraceae bacterium]|nr:hypothetical protein [Lachnospiraceae bacterium]